MTLEFVSRPGFDFLTSFGQLLGIPVHDNILTIPPAFGSGSVRKIDVGAAFKLIVHRYTLHEELVLRRLPSDVPNDLVSILFHSNETPVSLTTPGAEIHPTRTSEFAVQIASADLESEVRFPANRLINYVVVGVSSATLTQLLQLKTPNRAVRMILEQSPGFLFYERMGPDVQKLLRDITDTQQMGELSHFFYRIKVEELLYAVIDRLLRRESVLHSPVNHQDVEKLFRVRTAVLADLSEPPQLPELARLVGMSQTKLREVFKQVFGDSIYTYFQKARMDEAAILLRQRTHTVSEVGYRLGFSNLSHFTRLFNRHYGVNPRSYTAGEQD